MVNLNRPNQVNYEGPEWLALEVWLKEELDITYKRLSGLSTNDTELRQLQGRASTLQQMLNFRTQVAVVPTAR